MLKQRLITGSILFCFGIALIWLAPAWLFIGVVGLAAVLSAWEWARLVPFRLLPTQIIYTVSLILMLAVAYYLPAGFVLSLGALYVVWSLIAVIGYQCIDNACGFQFPPVRVCLGLMVLVPAWISYFMLREMGAAWVFYVLVLVIAADAGAYFAGQLLGRFSLAPRVSPKKTWEGLVGGLACVFLVTWGGSVLLPLHGDHQLSFWLLSMLAGLVSVIGDLSISLLKRLIGVKDTGSIFPGHGGILDRVDSLSATGIVFALGTLFFHF